LTWEMPRQETEHVGHQLRQRARTELGIAVSVGIGRTKLMAKLGSRAAKPDGLHVIGRDRDLQLRSELAISAVWGIGGKTRERLTSLGVTVLGDLDRVAREDLLRACGTTMAHRLRAIRNGTDDAEVRSVSSRSTLSSENATAGYNRRDWTVSEMLDASVARLSRRAQKAGVVASGMRIALLPAGGGTPINLIGPRMPATADASLLREMAESLRLTVDAPPLHGTRVTLTGLVRAEWAPVPLF